jgi:hypothetical protein
LLHFVQMKCQMCGQVDNAVSVSFKLANLPRKKKIFLVTVIDSQERNSRAAVQQ